MSIWPEVPPNERPFPFLSLPLELRMMIYRACVEPPNEEERDALVPKPVAGFASPPQSTKGYDWARRFGFIVQLYYPLIRSCHAIRAEAVPIFDNHGQLFPSIRFLYSFLRCIGRARRSRLRNLAFAYHLDAGHYRWEDKLAQSELAAKCFRLMARECHGLQSLCAHMNEQYLKRYSLIACHSDQSGRDDINLWALKTFNIGMVFGMRELRSIKRLEKVEFKPVSGAKDFNEDVKLELDEYAREMTSSRGKQQTKKTVRTGEEGETAEA